MHDCQLGQQGESANAGEHDAVRINALRRYASDGMILRSDIRDVGPPPRSPALALI